MNLARAQIIEPHLPTYTSINFTSGLPTNLEPPIASSSKDPASSSNRRAATGSSSHKDTARNTLPPRQPENPWRSKKNAHFIVSGEKGYSVWSNAPSPAQTTGKDKDSGAKRFGTWDKKRPVRDGPSRFKERDLGGSLDLAIPLPYTPLLALVGGGREPVYPPNKVVIYHDDWNEDPLPSEPGLEGGISVDENDEGEGRKKITGKVVASIEYSEAVRAVKARLGTLIVVLLETVIWYEYGMGHPEESTEEGRTKLTRGFWLIKKKEWKTCVNPQGFATISTDIGSCLLAIPGRQQGHINLIPLPPLVFPPSPDSNPSSDNPSHPNFRTPIINAHSHSLSSLACTSDGKYLVSSSTRGSIFRVWNVAEGGLEKELRRGVGEAVIWGVDLVYRPLSEVGVEVESPPETAKGHGKDKGRGKELWMVCWSDKGTVHVWGDVLNVNKRVRKLEEMERKNAQASSTPKQALNSLLKPYIPIPKYFQAIPSTALFRLPTEESAVSRQAVLNRSTSGSKGKPSMREVVLRERYVVAWHYTSSLERHQREDKPEKPFGKDDEQDAPINSKPAGQPGYLKSLELVLITHAGEWYRLAVPDRSSIAEDQVKERDATSKGKDKAGEIAETEEEMRMNRCKLVDWVDLHKTDEWD